MLYRYKIIRDFGFAPNPFSGCCTLATCKPAIRERSRIGDWVAGFAGDNTGLKGRLVYVMRVDEILSFDQYWNDARFLKKRPIFTSKLQYYYGDNIYHHINNQWFQENSHHSLENGINYINLNHDTRVDRVLISYTYWYFGESAICIPEYFENLVPVCRNYVVEKDDELIEAFINWISNNYTKGMIDLPFSWPDENTFIRFKGEKDN